MIDDTAIDIYVKLRDANRALRSLFPDYEEKAKPVKQVISLAMEESGKDVLPALIDLLEAVTDKGDSVSGVWLMAAAVDMVNEKGAKDIRTDPTELIRQLCQDLPGGAQA